MALQQCQLILEISNGLEQFSNPLEQFL